MKNGSDNVLTIEANPEIVELMQENYKLNGVSPKVECAIAGVEDGVEQPFFC